MSVAPITSSEWLALPQATNGTAGVVLTHAAPGAFQSQCGFTLIHQHRLHAVPST